MSNTNLASGQTFHCDVHHIGSPPKASKSLIFREFPVLRDTDHSRSGKPAATVAGYLIVKACGHSLAERKMNSRIAGLVSIAALLGLSGCASMSADECAMSDWRTIGFEDGAMGYTADRLGNHRKACAKHGVAPDFEAYQTGRKEGLRQYCQPSRGFNLGTNGGRYNGVCPGDMEPDFVDAFNTGHKLHNLRANVNSANSQIYSRQAELERNGDRIRQVEADLISSETSAEDRILLLIDLKELSERTGQIEAEIVELVEERAVYEQQLSQYEAMIADTNY